MPTSSSTAIVSHRTRRIIAIAVLIVAVLLCVAYWIVGAVAANVLATPERHFDPAQSPAHYSLAYQDVRFPAAIDQLPIAGWYIPRADATQAVILVHGKDSSRTAEFKSGFVELAQALHERGLAVLMIDLRGHGQSGDAHYSFGLLERRDIEGAAEWLKQQGFKPGRIGVLGISLGAGSSIGATADDPDIGALVEDSGYAAIYPIIQKEWSKASGLPDFMLPGTVIMGRVLYGYNVADSRPVDDIQRIGPRPVLIIHGQQDHLIPESEAEQLKAALPSAEMWIVPGVDHAGAYRADPATYTQRVADFFDKNLK